MLLCYIIYSDKPRRLSIFFLSCISAFIDVIYIYAHCHLITRLLKYDIIHDDDDDDGS